MESKKQFSRGTTASHKPERVFRGAHGLSAAVFKNTFESDGRPFTAWKLSLQRTYRDGKEWKTTPIIGRDDLLPAAHLMTQAYAYVTSAEGKGDEE